MLSLRRSLLTVAGGRTRTFLTDAYRCDGAWQERLECSLLKRAKADELYHKLSAMLDGEKKQIHAVDLDVFANSLTDQTYSEELEDLVHRFRLSAQSGTLLPSTHHAVVRFFLAADDRRDLVRILRDRLNYGIFPDYYLCNLLMDTFVKENSFRNAAVVASNQMLQEELDNDITRTMGLYSCLKYLADPTEWEEAKVEVEEQRDGDDDDEEEEDTRVRVDFLRNPYFDDHFDITDGEYLVGKTMLAIGKTDSSVLGKSVTAVGLACYNRWDELHSYLDKLESPVFAGTVDLAIAAIDKRVPENEEKLKNAFAKLTVDSKSLTEESKNAVHEAVNRNEEKEIQSQKKVYKEWESFRREELLRYMEHLNRVKRLQKVQQIKQELKEKEQLLFFFDNENQYDLVKEEKLKRMKKTQAKTKSVKDDLMYIPPEVRQPGFKRD